ncbi:hypothetical protein [Rhizobium binxianense]
MSHNLSLVRSYAVALACTLMVPVTLFQVDGQYGALPSSEIEEGEVDALTEIDPFEIEPAH